MSINTILVVDDNDADQFLAELVIDEFNDKITKVKAFDGGEALELLSSNELQPDVILLDINMPGVDGHEFLELYSKHSQRHAVVMLTTSSVPSDREKCLMYPFVKEYCVKPLSVEHLENIEKLIS